MSEASRDEFQLTRIASMSDAIFGFAITLMITGLTIPIIAKDANLPEIITALFSNGPGFAGVVLSFFLVAEFWKRHHALFRYPKSYDSKLIALNLWFLFSIVCIPFTTSLLLKNLLVDNNLLVIFYNVNFILSTITCYRLHRYVFNHLELHEKSANAHRIYAEFFFQIGIYLTVIGLSFFQSHLEAIAYSLFALEKPGVKLILRFMRPSNP